LLVLITQIINSVGKMQIYSNNAAAFVSSTVCLCFFPTSRSFHWRNDTWNAMQRFSLRGNIYKTVAWRRGRKYQDM